jgi:hypothetical protein
MLISEHKRNLDAKHKRLYVCPMNNSHVFLRAAEQELENLLKSRGIFEQVKALESVISAYRDTASRSAIEPAVSVAPITSLTPSDRVTRRRSGNFKNGIVDFLRDKGSVIRVAEYEKYLRDNGHNPKQLTSAFQALKSDGVIQIHKINGSNNKGYYGLHEWFENGEPKPEYQSEDYINDSK